MSDPPALPWVLRRRGLALALCITAMLLGIASALTLRPGTAVRDMLPAGSPASVALDQAFQDFQLLDDLLLMVSLDDPHHPERTDAAAVKTLRGFAERFTAQIENDTDVRHVRFMRGQGDAQNAAASLEQLAWSQAWWRLDDGQRAGVIDRLSPERMREALAAKRNELAAPGRRPAAWWDATRADPLGLLAWLNESSGENGTARTPEALLSPNESTLDLSEDGRALLIRIGGTRPANDLAYSGALVDRVGTVSDSVAAEIAGEFAVDVSWQLTGPYAIADYSASTTKRDMIVSIFVSLGLLTALFFVVYRDHQTLPMTLLTVNGGIVVAFGLYALGSGRLSPVTATCGAVLAGLGIDYCIHLITHAKSRSRADLAAAMREMRHVLFGACVTSALGFTAVAASGVRALTEFAVLGVLGLAGTLIMALCFLPAALARDPANPGQPTTPTDAKTKTDTLAAVRRLVDRAFDRPTPWLFGCAVVGGMAAAWLTFSGNQALRFASDLEAMHAIPNPPLEAQAAITERFGVRPSFLLVYGEADDPERLLEQASQVRRVLDALAVNDERVHGTFGLTDLLAAPQRSDALVLPDRSRVLAEFDAALSELGFAAEPFASFRQRLGWALEPTQAVPWEAVRGLESLARPLLPRSFFAGDAARQALTIVTLASPWELKPEAERAALLDAVRSALAPVPGVALTGLAVVGAEMQGELERVTRRLVWVAAAAVVVWLCVFFRNPWEVMAALFPAGIGLLVLLAAISVLDLELHAANLIALPLTLGLGVDDGIFLVSVTRRVRRARGSIRELREGLGRASSAIVMTSLTTLLAFGSLSFTQTPAIQSLGILSAVGVAACLFASLTGLVPILAMSHGRRFRRRRRSDAS